MTDRSQTEALIQERGKTHGPYPAFAQYVQLLKFWTQMQLKSQKRVLSAEHQECLDMIFHKIGRIVTGDPTVEDHWADLAGYATLGLKAIKDDGTGKTKPEGPQTAETTKPHSERLTYPEVQTEDRGKYLCGIQTEPFKGDVV